MRKRHNKHVKVSNLSFGRLRDIRKWNRGVTQMESLAKVRRDWNFSFNFNLAMAREYRLEGKYEISTLLLGLARVARSNPNFRKIPS